MRFGYVGERKIEPAPGLSSICMCCQGELIAHCGKYKIWHWHHKTKKYCDPWWESETNWHRNWKMLFSVEEQEVIRFDDKTGEKHISDVRTKSGYVFEFQHSPLKEAELLAREDFYGDALVWVVDGMRLEFDRFYFFSMLKGKWPDFNFGWYGPSKLPHKWSLARRPVFFDFGDIHLYRLESFDAATKKGAVKAFSKQGFIRHSGAAPTSEVLGKVLDPIGHRNREYFARNPD